MALINKISQIRQRLYEVSNDMEVTLNDRLSWLNELASIEKVREKVAFTTHTPVPAGHDRFKQDLVNKVFENRMPKE